MPVDPRFLSSTAPRDLSAILAATGGKVLPGAATDRRFHGVGSLEMAGPDEIGFAEDRRRLAALRATRAGMVLVPPTLAMDVPHGSIALLVDHPYLAFIAIVRLFHPRPPPRPGIHPTAVVAPSARIGEGTEIGPLAVIGDGAVVGTGCFVGPHACIGPGVVLGEGCRLEAHCSVSNAVLGRGVVLHPGARVGQEGFGFVPTPDGRFETAPQLGRVILGDAVEVGANTCIDRGALDDTEIGPGTRLDNLVQIGHNVRTGRFCILVGQSGISGSTTLGDHVTVAAQAGLVGHLRIGNAARIGAQAGVMRDVPEGTDVVGSPAWPAREFMRAVTRLRKLAAATGRGDADEETPRAADGR
jgi:UDP-3-O-[3-hydroxymyristoyl] glucosamine N-acyltransferase